MMIKQLAAAAAVTAFAAPAAIAGPYVNIEANSGFAGSDYTSTTIDNHIGFESGLGDNGSWYVQGGPAIVSPDGGDATTELSGKIGLGVDVSDSLNVYGEVAAITSGEIDFDEDLSYATKVGVKYSF